MEDKFFDAIKRDYNNDYNKMMNNSSKYIAYKIKKNIISPANFGNIEDLISKSENDLKYNLDNINLSLIVPISKFAYDLTNYKYSNKLK